MTRFSYKGRNAHGEAVSGVLEAVDSGAVADQLLKLAITPLHIQAGREPKSDWRPGWLKALMGETVRSEDVMLFSRQMYTLIRAGVPILRSLAGLKDSAVNPAFAKMLTGFREDLEAGRELSQGLRRYPHVFSSFYLSMVRVGEMTGRLEEIFLRLFEHLDFERTIARKVKVAVRYPLTVLATMASAIIVINIFVIPAFARVYAGLQAELPLMTRILINFSDLTVHYWFVGVALGVVFYAAFELWSRSMKGRYQWDKLKLRIPIAGKIHRKAALARFARSFALAARSGIPLVQAMTNVAQVADNAFIARRIEQMRDGVERGESILGAAGAAEVFTPVVLQMVAVGEETGALDDLMQEVAEMYEREVDYEINTLSAQIEPLLIIAVGGLVLILALGVFLPIWDLGQAALG